MKGQRINLAFSLVSHTSIVLNEIDGHVAWYEIRWCRLQNENTENWNLLQLISMEVPLYILNATFLFF